MSLVNIQHVIQILSAAVTRKLGPVSFGISCGVEAFISHAHI